MRYLEKLVKALHGLHQGTRDSGELRTSTSRKGEGQDAWVGDEIIDNIPIWTVHRRHVMAESMTPGDDLRDRGTFLHNAKIYSKKPTFYTWRIVMWKLRGKKGLLKKVLTLFVSLFPIWIGTFSARKIAFLSCSIKDQARACDVCMMSQSLLLILPVYAFKMLNIILLLNLLNLDKLANPVSTIIFYLWGYVPQMISRFLYNQTFPDIAENV